MPSVFEDPEGYMRDFQSRMKTMVENAADLNKAMEAATATAKSPDGEVRVTVGVGGALQELVLTSKSQAMTPRMLAAMIKETYDEAARLAGEASADALSSVFGEDSEVVQRARAAMPEQEQDKAAGPGQEQRRA